MPVAAPAPILTAPITTSRADDAAAIAAGGDFETFLTLLTAQLRNQDPLSPLEGTEFVAQLATFSSVEQLIGVNDRIDGLGTAFAGSAASGLSQWIGHDVAVADGSFRSTGEPVSFVAPEAGPGEAIEAVITAPGGAVVRRLAVFPDASGLASWDGRDSAGQLMAPQDLRLTLATTGEAGATEVPGEVLTEVVSIRGTDAGVVIDLADGRAVAPETIGRVRATDRSDAG